MNISNIQANIDWWLNRWSIDQSTTYLSTDEIFCKGKKWEIEFSMPTTLECVGWKDGFMDLLSCPILA